MRIRSFRSPSIGCLAAALLATAFAPVSAQPPQVQIIGSMSNFDVHQGSMPVADNFELDFIGAVGAGDFLGFYPGWGTPPRFDEIVIGGLDQGAEVMWLDRAAPIPFCSWVHFGVHVNPALPPTQVRAWWTKVIKQEQIPVPFQWWWLSPDGFVVDWLTLSPTYPRSVGIRRDWAISPEPLPLDQLQYDSTPVPWVPFDTFILSPGQFNDALRIPMEPGIRGYLVRYAVIDLQTGSEVTRFVTEMALQPDRSIGPVFVNFDLHQWNPNAVYDNVELDLFGDWLDPYVVWDWYAREQGPGIPAWGVPPLVRAFPAGMFPQMPQRSGVEVTWVDKFEPFRYCHTYHFGLTLDPRAMGPLPFDWTWVQAYWTNVVKMPVPVPWQFWQPLPGMAVRDIILYGGDEVGPVLVERQWVTLAEPIPLEALTWPEVDLLPWVPVPTDPIVMLPGQVAELNVPVGTSDRAALVRYTVRETSGELSTRVINQAVLDNSSSVPDGTGDPDQGLLLSPTQPNPSSGETAIRFRLPERADVQLAVLDVTGRQVALLRQGTLDAGEHDATWNGRTAAGIPAPSGVYFLSLRAGTRVMTQRIVLGR